MMLDKIWNHKFKGVFSAILLLTSRVFSKVYISIFSFLVKTNLGKCGSLVKIYPQFLYRFPSRIEIGNNVIISENVSFLSELNNEEKLTIQDRVTIGRNCKIDFTGGVLLKEDAHLSHNVIILTHDHGYDHTSTPIPKSLDIGKNVFVGMNTIITHNVSRIGDNAVIGVGSIVTKDVPDNAIVCGNPARTIKYTNS